MGRKAIGPFERMAAALPKGEFFMKKIISMSVILMLIVAMTTTAFAATQSVSADLEQGVVNVQMTEQSTSKILVLVEKDGVRYTYPIVDQDVNQFPLQMGNGDYSVRLMQNTEGNKYRELNKTTVHLNIKDSNQVFLNSIQDIEWQNDQQAIIKAKSLTQGLNTDEQKVKAIYAYITKNFKYDYSKAKTVTSGYFPNVEKIYTSKTGICYDYSAVFAAMLRSVGVPTKLVKGYSTPTKGVYHAWNEVFIGDKWKVIDTTTDSAYVQAGKTIAMYKLVADYKAEKIY